MLRTTSGRPASGTQYHLAYGDYAAVVASVGASLRRLAYGGRDLVVPFEADEVRPGFRGVTLAPWPNRIVDGHYQFRGRDFQLALTEPDRGQALHGLACWLEYEAIEVTEASVRLMTEIEPQVGYPWRIRVETTYSLAESGLTQGVRATNLSREVAPWGTGPHPYLVAGVGTVDDWTLEVPASEVLTVTPDRLSPVGLAAVETDAARFDFRTPRVIGDVQIDHAFTGLQRSTDQLATVRLTGPEGTGVAMSWDAACSWVQIHTADLPGGASQAGLSAGHRAGLAVEPTTCAPDAFNQAAYSHDTGVIALEPGVPVEASWRITAL